MKKKEDKKPKIKYKYYTMIGKKKVYIDDDIAERYHLENTSVTPWTKKPIFKEVDNG